MKSRFIIHFLLFATFSMYSQEALKNENSLESQFDNLYKTSRNYKINKIVEKQKFLALKTTVLDSIKELEKQISAKENEITLEKEKNKDLTTTIKTTKTDLDTAILKKNMVSFFGKPMDKRTYGFVIWGVIAFLLIGIFFYLYKFKSRDVITRRAENNLLEVEEEFEMFRKKTLLNEQKLRRQIQDEINKQRKQ